MISHWTQLEATPDWVGAGGATPDDVVEVIGTTVELALLEIEMLVDNGVEKDGVAEVGSGWP